jgi:hypothetical protein
MKWIEYKQRQGFHSSFVKVEGLSLGSFPCNKQWAQNVTMEMSAQTKCGGVWTWVGCLKKWVWTRCGNCEGSSL